MATAVWYRFDRVPGLVAQVQVLRETDKYVILPGGTRELKQSPKWLYTKSKTLAYSFAIERLAIIIADLEDRLGKAREYFGVYEQQMSECNPGSPVKQTD